MSFSRLGLADALLRAVADQGYSEPTPIQAKAIPAVLGGGDVLATAQTGTGKTAGFVLPMLQRLASGSPPRVRRSRCPVRALILVPTRELAAQVETSVRTYGLHLPLTSATVIGGASAYRQASALRRGVDIVVATPGRLLDHHGQGNVDLSAVETFVLDEADRMLDMGFLPDLRRVMALLPSKRQNLLFSATFSNEVRTLARSFLDDPATIDVCPANATVDVVDQVVHPVDQGRKRALLSMLIGRNDWRQVLVFTRTKHGADRLTRELRADGIDALAIHGNKSQGIRTRALAQFKDGGVRVLVATDIAARGIDIEQLPHVVNFDLPNVPEDYVHRIGRTGRAGASGQAISLVSGDERVHLRNIERLIRRSIRSEVLDGFAPDPSAPSATMATRNGRSPGMPGRRNAATDADEARPGRRHRRRTSGQPTTQRNGSHGGRDSGHARQPEQSGRSLGSSPVSRSKAPRAPTAAPHTTKERAWPRKK